MPGTDCFKERDGLDRISLYAGGPQADGLLLNANENSWPVPEGVAEALAQMLKTPRFNTGLTRPKSPVSLGGGFPRAAKSSEVQDGQMPRRAGRPGAAMDSANPLRQAQLALSRTSIQRALNLPLNEVSFNRYPEIDAAGLRQDLSLATGVSADNVRVGNGSSELLCAACYAFGGEKRKIAYICPSFSMYETYAALSGGIGLPFALEKDFSLDFERLRFFLREERPALMIVCNPNNPTGNLYSAAELARTVKDAGCIVIVDEAYMEFAPEGSSLLDYLRERKNLAVSRTFSKAYGLAGLRVGYMAAGDPRVTRALGKVLLPYNVNSLSLNLARTVYAKRALYDQTARAIVKERERVHGRLSSLGLKVYPSAANFLFFAVPGEGKTAALSENLAANHIFVRDFSRNPALAGLRMTVGVCEENEKALAAIQEFLK